MREELITLSYMYSGEYDLIKKAIDCNVNIKVNTKFIDYLNDNSIGVIVIGDSNYPANLYSLHNPPFVLYYLGDISLITNKLCAVIGARNHLEYSMQICKKLVKQLCSNNCVVVSGLARGIDTIAHSSAIENNGRTIGVIGFGFNRVYPASNSDLAKVLEENHLIISEYPPNVFATKRFFPMRNRIIASLCEDVYVIEASSKSGSLITANLALDLGKNIYCAPGSALNDKYLGSHQLINDGAYLLELKEEV